MWINNTLVEFSEVECSDVQSSAVKYICCSLNQGNALKSKPHGQTYLTIAFSILY